MSKLFKILSMAALLTAFIGCEEVADDNGNEGSPEFVRYIKKVEYSSNNAGWTNSFGILLPASYESAPETKYPVVYMLHGYGENGKDWSSWVTAIQNLENQGLQEMIYVFPNCGNSYYSNYYNDNSRKYMDLITKDLIPYIDTTYRTIADRKHRAVMGYSMGGFGAMVLPLKNPDLFSISVPLSMSFRTDEQYMNESQSGWDNQWGKIFGGKGKTGEARLTDYYKSHCPFYQFIPENKETLSQVKWFFHCGDDEEQLLIANDSLHVQLCKFGYEHEFRISDGGHDGTYWRTAARETLPWIQHVMNDGQNWTRSMGILKEKTSVLNEDGTFSSKKYNEAEEKDGLAMWFLHRGLSKDIVDKCVGLMSQSASAAFQYMILPCDLEQKSLAEWMAHYKATYEVGKGSDKSQVIAVGDTGRDAWAIKDEFKRYYFIDADLTDEESSIVADENKFYYIEGVDDSRYYEDSYALYVSCKTLDADFEYRIRNGLENKDEQIMLAIQNAVEEFKYL